MGAGLQAVADIWLPIASAVGAFLAFTGGICWFLIRHGHKIVSTQAAQVKSVTELTKIVGKLSDRVTRLSETNILLQQGLQIREKDHARLEGKLEMVTTSLVDAVGHLRQLTGSTEAMWDVMAAVAPEHVRRRNGQ